MKSGRTRDVVVVVAGALLVAGCGGGKHFENKARPAAPIQLTGVVRDNQVDISPKRVGAGPVILIVSNQTDLAHTITLEGEGTTDTVGPIQPLDTAKLQQTLKPGSYTLKAGSEQASAQSIAPGRVTVTRDRQSSSDTLLLP